jgi:hypothetical protein
MAYRGDGGVEGVEEIAVGGRPLTRLELCGAQPLPGGPDHTRNCVFE